MTSVEPVSRTATVSALIGRGRDWFDASILGRWWAELLDLMFVDRAVALAAKAFVAFLPAVLTIAALAPPNVQRSMVATMEHRLGLSGQSLTLVQTSLASGEPVDESTGILSSVLLLFYATTFTTALQRVYQHAWRRPTSRDRVRELKGVAWLFGVIALLSLFGLLSRALSGVIAASLVAVVVGCCMAGMWWSTSYLMLRRHVRWRVLLPSALLTAAGSALYTASASVWVPRSMIANQEQFGFFGVSMTLVSWFVGFALIVVASVALGPVLATDPGRVGRLVRGPEESLLRPGAPAAVGVVGGAVAPRLIPGAG